MLRGVHPGPFACAQDKLCEGLSMTGEILTHLSRIRIMKMPSSGSVCEWMEMQQVGFCHLIVRPKLFVWYNKSSAGRAFRHLRIHWSAFQSLGGEI